MTRRQELLRGGRDAASPAARSARARSCTSCGGSRPAEARVPSTHARSTHSAALRSPAGPRSLCAHTHARPTRPGARVSRAFSLSLARAPTLLRPQALRGAGPQVPAGRPELFIGGKILDVPAARSVRGRRAMLSAFRAHRAPLLLTAVLSETWAAKGGSHFLCHRAISPSLGSPPAIPEPWGPSLPPGRAGIRGAAERPARPLQEPRGQRRPRLPPASSSCKRVTERGRGWPRLCAAPTGLWLSRCPGLLGCCGVYFCTTPLKRGAPCARVSPSFSALPPLGTPVIGTDRNSESF